jgi:hypothetical protein
LITQAEWNRRVYSLRASCYSVLVSACRQFGTKTPCELPLPPPGEPVSTEELDQALEEFIAWRDVIRQGTTLETCPLRDRTQDTEADIYNVGGK